MKTSPYFSVIVCTYNRRNLVLSTLASLRRQTCPYNLFEVIVVDNGSKDGTLAAVRTYVSAGAQERKRPQDCWQVLCLEEPRNGLAYARNAGLAAASGEIAVFLDDDALAEPNFLERLCSAYEETGADAVGGHVELRWEAPRPYWLTDELVEVLGYFSPAKTRSRLVSPAILSSCNFSAKIEVLRAIGCFSPMLSKRVDLPISVEMEDLCQRLHEAGCALWYEPAAVVTHRIPAARLTRPFFVGHAYWQGRGEVLLEHVRAAPIAKNQLHANEDKIFAELREYMHLALVDHLLQRLAGQSSIESLLAHMERARSWGRLRQRIYHLRQPALSAKTPVLFVRPVEDDPAAELLIQSLIEQGVDCTVSIADISLSWLWRFRATGEREGGVVHFYRAGAFHLGFWQQRRLRAWVWLAKRWGIRFVATDAGGWWQSAPDVRFLGRRSLERRLLYASDVVLGFTRQPEQLYADRKLRRQVRCLPHPGFRNYYPPVLRAHAHKQLGMPEETEAVYLCFAYEHSEQEVVLLMEAFLELKEQQQKNIQLLLVGLPADKRMPSHILRLAASEPSIHFNVTTPGKEDMPFYLGASDIVVLPHFAVQTAGVLELAFLALSYERVVVAPNLPRFRGMLPPRAAILYDPTNPASLVRALSKAQGRKYHLNEKEAAALDASASWREYAERVVRMYRPAKK